MKKVNIIIGIGIIVIVIGGSIIFSNKVEQPISRGETGTFQENIKKEIVLLVIDDSEGTPKTFEAEFNEGMTAFDLLKIKAVESNLTLKTKNFDMGVMIESIGNKENGQDGKYWMYYVNEEMPMVAVDKKEIKPGDKVEFKFEKSIF